MQKLINVFAVASFVVSGAVVGGGVYLYVNRDSIVDGVKSEVMDGVKSQLGDFGELVGGGTGLPLGGGALVPEVGSDIISGGFDDTSASPESASSFVSPF